MKYSCRQQHDVTRKSVTIKLNKRLNKVNLHESVIQSGTDILDCVRCTAFDVETVAQSSVIHMINDIQEIIMNQTKANNTQIIIQLVFSAYLQVILDPFPAQLMWRHLHCTAAEMVSNHKPINSPVTSKTAPSYPAVKPTCILFLCTENR